MGIVVVFLGGAFSIQKLRRTFTVSEYGRCLSDTAIPACASSWLIWLRRCCAAFLVSQCYLHFQAKDAGQRTTIYKRDPSKQYGLKMKTSRAFFSEVERRFDTMPFTLRYLLLLVASPCVQSWMLCMSLQTMLTARLTCFHHPVAEKEAAFAALHWGLLYLSLGVGVGRMLQA